MHENRHQVFRALQYPAAMPASLPREYLPALETSVHPCTCPNRTGGTCPNEGQGDDLPGASGLTGVLCSLCCAWQKVG